MKEHALAIAAQGKNPIEKLNRLREYLQALILRSLHESEAFTHLSFVGGTALRFLHGLPRFSEDLDFSWEAPASSPNYQPQQWLAKLKRDMAFANFDVSITWSEKNIVHNGWVNIVGLLKEVGLSGHAEQKLSVKIEIDTRPPPGATLVRTVVNKHVLLALQHHDLPSLMAGKIHALCCRPYTKGRDWYDLLWYRSQRPPLSPNLTFLQNSLEQTQSPAWQAAQWSTKLEQKMQQLEWPHLIKDVAPFLENPEEQALLTPEFISQAIRSNRV